MYPIYIKKKWGQSVGGGGWGGLGGEVPLKKIRNLPLYKAVDLTINPAYIHSKNIAVLEGWFCRYASPRLLPIVFPYLYSIKMYFTFSGKRVTRPVGHH